MRKECQQYVVNGCLTLTGFSKIFPKTKFEPFLFWSLFLLLFSFKMFNFYCYKRAPNTCSNVKALKKSQSKQAVLYQSRFTTFKETPELPSHYKCPATTGAIAQITYKRDPALIALLTIVYNYLFSSPDYNVDLYLDLCLRKADKELICRNIALVIFAVSIAITLMVLYAMCSSTRKKNFSPLYSQVNIDYSKS
jgi:hypothetical protein